MNDVRVRFKPITYDSPVKVYIPVYQMNFDYKGDLCYSPTFVYHYEEASQDEQMVASMEPDYILELTGHFKATTKDLIIKVEEDEDES